MSKHTSIHITQARNNQATINALSDVLIDCVKGGASISFMHPLSKSKAEQFWIDALTRAERNERVILVAEDSNHQQIIGCVQLIVDLPENQPHRADVSKVLVHSNYRNQGIASQLMAELEHTAHKLQKLLLVLDTTTGSAAEKLYTKLGWQKVGDIPNFALLPNGELSGTTVFYRQLAL